MLKDFDEFFRFCFEHGGTLRNHKQFGEMARELRQQIGEPERCRWISVKERLPESSGQYLAAWRAREDDRAHACTGELRYDMGEGFVWDTGEDWYLMPVYKWMPLPTPPAETD